MSGARQNAKGPDEAATSVQAGSTNPTKDQEMNRKDDSTKSGVAPVRDLDLIDRVHDLRDMITLIDMASMSVGLKQERNGLQRGLMVAEDMVSAILQIIDPEAFAQEGQANG